MVFNYLTFLTELKQTSWESLTINQLENLGYELEMTTISDYKTVGNKLLHIRWKDNSTENIDIRILFLHKFQWNNNLEPLKLYTNPKVMVLTPDDDGKEYEIYNHYFELEIQRSLLMENGSKYMYHADEEITSVVLLNSSSYWEKPEVKNYCLEHEFDLKCSQLERSIAPIPYLHGNWSLKPDKFIDEYSEASRFLFHPNATEKIFGEIGEKELGFYFNFQQDEIPFMNNPLDPNNIRKGIYDLFVDDLFIKTIYQVEEFEVEINEEKSYEFTEFLLNGEKNSTLSFIKGIDNQTNEIIFEKEPVMTGTQLSITILNKTIERPQWTIATEFTIEKNTRFDKILFNSIILGFPFSNQYWRDSILYVRPTINNKIFWEQITSNYKLLDLEGDNLLVESGLRNITNGIEEYIIKTNWKTGWLEYYFEKVTINNEIDTFIELKKVDDAETSQQSSITTHPVTGSSTELKTSPLALGSFLIGLLLVSLVQKMKKKSQKEK